MLDAAASALLFALAAALLRIPLRRAVRSGAGATAGAALIALALTGIIVFSVSRSRSFQLFGHLVTPRLTREKVVALTLDDGPTAEFTPQILAILQRDQVRATFFLIGREIAENRGAARAIAAAGEEIGNHSYDHRRMVFHSEGWVAGEVERTDALIRASGYHGPILFRSPYAKRFVSLPLYLARHGRLNVLWDVEPESDPRVAGNTDAIVRAVLAETRPGSIILLHPMYASGAATRRALPAVIEGLKKNGYRCVTVSELLARQRAPR